jgi:hypothetical protein
MMITSPLLAVASDHLSPSISALQPSASFFISSKSPSAAKWCGNSQSGRALISLANEAAALAPTGLHFETAIGSRLRRVFPIQDHYFRRSRTWTVEVVVVIKLLLGPRRRIAEPVVFYRCAQ